MDDSQRGSQCGTFRCEVSCDDGGGREDDDEALSCSWAHRLLASGSSGIRASYHRTGAGRPLHHGAVTMPQDTPTSHRRCKSQCLDAAAPDKPLPHDLAPGPKIRHHRTGAGQAIAWMQERGPRTWVHSVDAHVGSSPSTTMSGAVQKVGSQKRRRQSCRIPCSDMMTNCGTNSLRTAPGEIQQNPVLRDGDKAA